MQRKQISPAVVAGRIVSHGLVTPDADGHFSLGVDTPFTIYIRPKDAVEDVDVVLSCNLLMEQGETPSPSPFPIYDWSPMELIELVVPTAVQQSYDIYWGSGYYIEEV